ncbi:hypothetical protein [Nonomuraea typhae]|uniref:hypothetical protein n=1 Tax=Nonomuraea typhae TaxID=2603600 RepID=UPI0012FC6BE3|nr:hypothetical protein [Nonomuraea typhae]
MLRRHLHALWRRLGRRGVFLLFVAYLYTVYGGLGFLLAPPETRANPTYVWLATLFPLNVWAALWLLAGACCLVQAWQRWDRIAYSAAAGLMAAFGAIHLVGGIAGVLPRGWVSASIWLFFAGVIALISNWPEAWDRGRR